MIANDSNPAERHGSDVSSPVALNPMASVHWTVLAGFEKLKCVAAPHPVPPESACVPERPINARIIISADSNHVGLSTLPLHSFADPSGSGDRFSYSQA
jgi:hypothetical protein